MSDSDPDNRLQRLKQKIRADIEQRKDISSFEFKSTDDPGIELIVEEADKTRLYNITLEKLPDGTEETHWVLLGDIHED